MSYYVVDCEADGQYPLDYSMVCFGAVKVTPELDITFYGETSPISDKFDPEALSISGFSREQHSTFEHPLFTMKRFVEWIKNTTIGKPIFISDNPAFDWMFMNTYMHKFAGENPFGWSARRIGDLWCGMEKDAWAKWKWMRETIHDHNPVNDAKGNAEALLKMKEKGLKISFK
jgi:hypothetical protein